MKYYLVSLILLSFATVLYSQDPLVISRENFNITASIDTLFEVGNLDGIVNPEEGANKMWDYSKIDVSIKNIHTVDCKKPVEPLFHNSTCWFPDNFEIIAQERGFYVDDYSELTDFSYSFVGIGLKKQSYFLGDLTPDVTDSIIFPAQLFRFDNSRIVMNFPTSYGTVTNSVLTKSIDFQISLGIFTLDHAPCKKITHISQIDSVVGWGNLVVPNIKTINGKSTPNNVLLVKRYYTTVDSLYLNGEPAPFALLSAFSLKQGYTVKTQRYMFMRADSKMPLLSLNFGTSNFDTLQSVFFDISTELLTSVKDKNDEIISSKVFPNPVSGSLSIEIPQLNETDLQISFSDINGTELYKKDLLIGNKFDIKLPDQFNNGSYFYKIRNKLGKIISEGKFIVSK
jgi:hypothetical protein